MDECRKQERWWRENDDKYISKKKNLEIEQT
jgi:hypothetical protein